MTNPRFVYERIKYETEEDADRYGDKNRLCVHLLNQQAPFKIISNQHISPDEPITAGAMYYWLIEVQNQSNTPTFPLLLFLQAAEIKSIWGQVVAKRSQATVGMLHQVENWFIKEFGPLYVGLEIRLRPQTATQTMRAVPTQTPPPIQAPAPVTSQIRSASQPPSVYPASTPAPSSNGHIKLEDFEGMVMQDGSLI